MHICHVVFVLCQSWAFAVYWVTRATDRLPLSVCTFGKHSCLFTLKSRIGRDAWLDFHQELAGGQCTGPVQVLWSLQLPTVCLAKYCSNATAEKASVGFSESLGGGDWQRFCYTFHKRLKDLNDILSWVLTTYFSYSLMNIWWIVSMSQSYELLMGRLTSTCLNNF